METEQKDSFTIGTAGTLGCVKVYFDNDNAEEKIKKAKALYYEYVEKDRMRRQMQ